MSVTAKKDIRALSVEQLKEVFSTWSEPAFRAKQVHEWLWKKSATSFEAMTNLSKNLREKLEENYSINAVQVLTTQKSSDGTIKNAFKLYDENIIEGVLIPSPEFDRMTACISSQVGCSLTCKFCATGYLDRKRNLNADEIYDQVVLLREQAVSNYNVPLTNIVLMGMGEPLLNYKNVIAGIDRVISPDGLGMSAQRITLSTAGIAKMIRQLADDGVRFNLALSLHAANDAKRNEIMPINESNNLKVLGEALNYFYKKTRNRVTFEYIVFNDFNDSLEDAKELYEFSKYVPCKINIIEYNPISFASFQNTKEDKLEKFKNYLESKRLIVNVRRSRGKDIDAACGQLANKSIETNEQM